MSISAKKREANFQRGWDCFDRIARGEEAKNLAKEYKVSPTVIREGAARAFRLKTAHLYGPNGRYMIPIPWIPNNERFSYKHLFCNEVALQIATDSWQPIYNKAVWEYGDTSTDYYHLLDRYGAFGWEAYAVANKRIYMKCHPILGLQFKYHKWLPEKIYNRKASPPYFEYI